MKVLYLIGARPTLLVLVVAFLPWPARAQRRDALLPDGVCGNRNAMLEASHRGRTMLHQALTAGMPWADKSLNEYVNRLGQNLARSSGSQQVFSFYVLYNPEVNAVSFPGGYIVINSGAISLAESEAELASVLSHEIAHENSCDWRTAPGKRNLLELICMLPMVILGEPAGIVAEAGSGWGVRVVRARFSRAVEQRADRLAAQYMVRAGYDPHAAAQFIERFHADQERGGGETGGLLATHPRSTERRKKLEKIILHLPPPAFALHDKAEFLRMRQAVREYDEMYSRLVGVRVPGHNAPPPVLSRRTPSPAAP